MHRLIALAALALALSLPAAAEDRRPANPASHEPAFFEQLLEGRVFVYAKPYNKGEADRAHASFYAAGGKAYICTRHKGSTKARVRNWRIAAADKHRAILSVYKDGADPADNRNQLVVFYDGESGRHHQEWWWASGRQWVVFAEGWVQESWPRVLADSCGKLKLPEGVAVNEAQTERRLKPLKKQDPAAALARFPGWESGDPEATGRGVKPN